MSPGIRPQTAGAAPSVPSDQSCPPARRAWLRHTAGHCWECLGKRHPRCRPPKGPTCSHPRLARISRSQARRAGGAGSGPRRRRRVPRASALTRQRVGIGARDRFAGRVRTREPSVPRTREAGPLACGRRGTSPRKPAEGERSERGGGAAGGPEGRAPLSRMPHPQAGSLGAPPSAIPTSCAQNLGQPGPP